MSGLLQVGDPLKRGTPVGIDLGTTHSLVARVVGSRPECMPVDDDGGRLLPSIVNFDSSGLPTVGKRARALAERHPRDTIVSVKRFMGKSLGELDPKTRGAYTFAGTGTVARFVAGGKEVTPVEVSAEILKALRRRAEGYLQEKIEQAVVTVPAYFDDAQRQATKDAGRLAGLEVLRILNEPTAAALAYGLDKRVNGTFAVYDLGGGTFDISILSLEDGVFRVMATKGETALGGDDFDRAILRSVLERDLARPLDWEKDVGERIRTLLFAARAAKEALTESESIEVDLGDRRVPLSRVEFEGLAEVRALVARTTRIARQALLDAKLSPTALDGVVLVGGMTRVPMVRRAVRELFGKEPLADIDPDEVVALGAAVQADLLAGKGPRDDVLLLDVNPLSLGLETMGGVVEKVIPRNSTIPASAAQVFTTFQDGQTAMDIHVLQGERELVEDNRSLARFRLSRIPALSAGLTRVQVTFAIDADGILSVSAKELSTGVEQSIAVKPSHGLSDEDVERMLLDSLDNAEDDVRRRLLRDGRVEVARIVSETRKRLGEHHFLLLPGEKERLEEAIAAAERAMGGEDQQQLRLAKDALVHLSNPFAERVMNHEIERAIKGRAADEFAGSEGEKESPGLSHLRSQEAREAPAPPPRGTETK